MAHDAAAEDSLYDFIYINRESLSLYNAQLDKDGLLTHSIVTKSAAEQDKRHMEGNAHLVSGGYEKQEHIAESTQNNFDASHAMPLNVMCELNRRGLIRTDITQAQLGQIVLFSGRLQVVDYRLMAAIIRPATRMHINGMPIKTAAERQAKKDKQKEVDVLADMIENVPKLIQFRVFDDERSAWGSISSGSLMVHSLDFVMKHSVSIPGRWHVLAVVDALPESIEADNLDAAVFKYMTEFESGYAETFIHLRSMMGRRLEEYGISPLAIFRTVE